MKLYSMLLGVLMPGILSFHQTLAQESITTSNQLEQWYKLLHYEGDVSNIQSAILSPEFFLSPDGRNNPEQELKKNIAEMQNTLTTQDPDQHPQCKFKGRYIWLKQQGMLNGAKEIHCPSYEKWRGENTITSISYILATGYFSNPASFYGHTLVKFNSKNSNKLLDETINYGAIIPDDENPISYIIKGISGLYEAGFTHRQYYYHNHRYGSAQLRDQWEYEFDLTQPEADLLSAHAWELLGKKFDYYFFTKNCAYRMAEIFELANSIDIIPENPLYILPQSVIQKIGGASRNGKLLVKNIIYHPSQQTSFSSAYQNLKNDQKILLALIIEHPETIDSDSYKNLTDKEKLNLVEILSLYYQYQKNKYPDKSNSIKRKQARILKERFSLPVSDYTPEIIRPEAPHNGRKPGLIRIGAGIIQNKKEIARLTIRPAYYDDLDAGPGHIKNGELSMGEVDLYITSNKASLNRLTFVQIQSSAYRSTNLPGDSANLWRLSASYEKLPGHCQTCSTPVVQGDIGTALSSRDQWVLNTYVGGGVTDNVDQNGFSFARAAALSILHFNSISIRTELQIRHHLNSRWKEEILSSVEARYAPSLNSEVRLQIDHDHQTTATIGVGLYW